MLERDEDEDVDVDVDVDVGTRCSHDPGGCVLLTGPACWRTAVGDQE